MNRYCDMERELAHIKRAIALLEQTRACFANKTPVSEPAYWRARLDRMRERAGREKALERQLNELFARLERLDTQPSGRHERSRLSV